MGESSNFINAAIPLSLGCSVWELQPTGELIVSDRDTEMEHVVLGFYVISRSVARQSRYKISSARHPDNTKPDSHLFSLFILQSFKRYSDTTQD